MKTPLGPPPVKVTSAPRVWIRAGWVDLKYAAICVNELPAREVLFDLRERACPSCGSESWAPLAGWLQERAPR